MSGPRYSIFSARAVFDERLTATEKCVLAALGTYSNNEGWCYPSQATLAARLGVSRQTISAAIQRLAGKDFGYIAIRARTTPGKGKIGNEYRVVLDPPDVGAEPMSSDDDNGEALAREADVRPSRQRKAAKGRKIASKPVSVQPDNGPMSAQDDTPMSVQPDIVERTIPLERSHSLTGDFALDGGGAAPMRKAKPKARAYTADFEALWKSWPRNRRERSDKPKAFERWRTGVERWGVDAVAQATRRYLAAPDTRKEDFRYCCLAEVFLNGKLEAAIEAVSDLGSRAEADQVWTDGRWCWPDGTPVEAAPAR